MIQIGQKVSWRSTEQSVERTGIVRAVVKAGEGPTQLLSKVSSAFRPNFRKFTSGKTTQARFLIEVIIHNRKGVLVSYWYCCRVSSITAQNRSKNAKK